jgi:addiction module HigA family antidote
MRDGQHDEFAPVTPGEILAEEFLAGYGLSQAALARFLEISPNRIAEIVNNRRRITADTALRFGLFFGTSPEFWQNLQGHYDLKMAYRALPRETAQRIAETAPRWSRWPQHEDDLPIYPEWEERCEDERRIWATRLGQAAFGVIVVPATTSQHYLLSPPGQFHVEIVMHDPHDGWTRQAIEGEWVETYDEALAKAAHFREGLEALAMEALL